MYLVGHLRRDGDPVPKAVVAKLPGGCTTSELEREMVRVLRSAAVRKFGGRPVDWAVHRISKYSNPEVAEYFAAHFNGNPSERI